MYNENTTLFCRRQMGSDEYVLWHGRPEKKGRVLSGPDVWNLIFSIIWTVFACAMCIPAFMYGADSSTLFIIFFPLVGIGMMIGQLCKVLRIKNHTEYVITNKRLYRRMGKKIDSYASSVTMGYETEYHRNGNATIRFPMAIDHSKGRVRVNGREIPQYVSLINIGEVDRVQQALSNMSVEN